MKAVLAVVAIIIAACLFFIAASQPRVDADASEKKAQFKAEQKASAKATMCKDFPDLTACSK